MKLFQQIILLVIFAVISNNAVADAVDRPNTGSLRIVSIVSPDILGLQVYDQYGFPVDGVKGELNAYLSRKRAEKKIDVLRTALSLNDPVERVIASLRKMLENTDNSILASATFDAVQRADSFNLRQYIETVDEDSLLFLSTRYYMTPSMESVRVETHANLYQKSSFKLATKSSKFKYRHPKPYSAGSFVYLSEFVSNRYDFENAAELSKEVDVLVAEYKEKFEKEKHPAFKRKLVNKRSRAVKRLIKEKRKETVDQLPNPQAVWTDNNSQLLLTVFDEGLLEISEMLDRYSGMLINRDNPLQESVEVNTIRLTNMLSYNTKVEVINAVFDKGDASRDYIVIPGPTVYSLKKNELLRQ